MRKLILLATLIAMLLSSNSIAQNNTWQADLAEWRAQHAAELQKPDGWLALVGLEWLQQGDNTFGSAADNKIHLPASAPAHVGVLRSAANTVNLIAPSSGFPRNFLIDGKAATARALPVGTDSDKDNPRLRVGSLEMYVILRGNRFALRIKDAESTALKTFHGLTWFPADGKYRVKARWNPYNPQHTTTLDTLIGTRYSQPVPGGAEFAIDGKSYKLEPVIEDPSEQKLFFIIRDTTSKTSTYGACRFLYTGYPTKGLTEPGELVLDFNRLENPPCAYTTFATCPLPPVGNRLPIAIPAGEKRYHD